jgi:hypothetical protein
MPQWYQYRAQVKGTAEIVIYDEIGAFGMAQRSRR